MAKIIVWYNNNKNTLPKYCLFDSNDLVVKKVTSSSTSSSKNKTIYSNSSHSRKSGKGYMGQKTSYYCFPHSLRQCLRKLYPKLSISEDTLASYCGTTTKGTGHSSAIQGVKVLNNKKGTKLSLTWKNFSDLGDNSKNRWKALGKLIEDMNHDVIIHSLYRNKWGHYEVIEKIDLTHKMVVVNNSLGTKQGNGYNGYLEKRTFSEFESYIKNNLGGQPSIGVIKK